jgi:ketosteroid isomerase-like protein
LLINAPPLGTRDTAQAMSQQDLDTISAVYEAWNGADRYAETSPFIADDFEYVNPEYAVEPGIRRGPSGWLEAMDNLYSAFEEFEHRLGEMVEVGDRILCFTTFVATAAGSRITVEHDEAQLWTLRDGKIVRFEWFHSRREAVEAAELSK